MRRLYPKADGYILQFAGTYLLLAAPTTAQVQVTSPFAVNVGFKLMTTPAAAAV